MFLTMYHCIGVNGIDFCYLYSVLYGVPLLYSGV